MPDWRFRRANWNREVFRKYIIYLTTTVLNTATANYQILQKGTERTPPHVYQSYMQTHSVSLNIKLTDKLLIHQWQRKKLPLVFLRFFWVRFWKRPHSLTLAEIFGNWLWLRKTRYLKIMAQSLATQWSTSDVSILLEFCFVF